MLASVNSHEIAEWKAYERAFGPIDNHWVNVALQAIHHELRVGNRMFQGAQWGDEKGPIKEWVELPRPDQILKTPEQLELDELLDEEQDDDEEEEG